MNTRVAMARAGREPCLIAALAKTVSRSGRRLLVGTFVAAAVSAFALVPVAQSKILQISGLGFTLHRPDGLGYVGEELSGTLSFGNGLYYAPVVFPTDGVRVCSFALIYRDAEASLDVAASLKKKSFKIGGNALNAPVVMAEVSSSGTSNSTRRARETTINNAKVSTTNAFYYVEIFIPDSTEINILGVQIDYRSTCP